MIMGLMECKSLHILKLTVCSSTQPGFDEARSRKIDRSIMYIGAYKLFMPPWKLVHRVIIGHMHTVKMLQT